MRLHRLRVSAFQAFAGTEEVDFDALSAAGLFLLHGDTGAGKTTLLDAICFALYGEVPGARARDARLRSDHAAPELRTEVELEATLRDRRVRIVRRPRQERPKLRGEGMTEEGHACTVEALDDAGSWTVLAARPDEARAELADLLGMTCEQFCQVVLLPQGGFAEFLRAPSDKRQEVLEQLFGTRRFAEVEWWLRDRRRAARVELEDQLRAVRDVVARLAQAAGEEPPAGWEESLDSDADGSVRAWAGALSVGAQAGAATAEQAALAARAARSAAEAGLAAASELSDRRARHVHAVEELARWEARRSVRDDAQRELLTARRAAPVAALLEAAAARGEELETASAVAETAWEALGEEVLAELAAPAASAARPAGTQDRAAAEPADDRGAAPADDETDAPAATLFDATPTLFDVTVASAAPPQPDADAPHVDPRDLAPPTDGAPVEPDPLDPASPAAPPALRRHANGLRTRAGALGALVAVEERLVRDEAALVDLLRAADAAAATVAETARSLEAAAAERAQLEATLHAASRAADRIEGLVADERTVRERAAHAAERDRLAARQPAVADELRAAVDAEQRAHAAWLDLRERRLAGMAAELAAGLRPGEPCAVCGATEHPAPAHARDDATAAAQPASLADHEHAALDASAQPASLADHEHAALGASAQPASLADQERAAQQAHAALAEERAARERAATDLQTALAAARAVAGDEPRETLDERARQLAAELREARAQADALPAAERALAALATTTAAHEQRRREAEQAEATARAAYAERSGALASDRARIEQGRGDAPSVQARADALRTTADACEAAARALEDAARARAAHREAAQAAAAAAHEAGFDDADSAHAAVRDAAALDDLERRLREFDDALAERRALVQDPALKAAAAQPAPDLDALRAAATAAAQEDERSHGRNTVEQRRLADVTRLVGDLDSELDALAPVIERERRVRELAQLVDGSSASNRLRMRLSAYVLAARLEEVATAATARLDRMTNGRYALVHSDEGGRGRSRGGLELRVVDGWTGQERPPATLSGGESFLASLALALGLADVVAAEAGGSRLETLFIDEGFGSLDERTLDEVLDVLDALREGGRAVGIVSHVAELRQRIPTKLHVVKGRTGSRVDQAKAETLA